MLIIKSSLKGQGTKENPYLIKKAVDLIEVKYYPGAYFLQTEDLDMKELTSYKSELPISNISDDNCFSGIYNGGGNKITNLQLEIPDQSSIGLFAPLTAKSVIKNLNLVDIKIIGDTLVGGITGHNSRGAKIINCSVTGEISGNEVIGGIAGDNDGLLKSSSVDIILEGNKDIGGLAGRNWYYGALIKNYINNEVYRERNNGTILNSSSAGIINGQKRIGGIAGFNYGIIEGSSSSAIIKPGKYYIGEKVGADFSNEN